MSKYGRITIRGRNRGIARFNRAYLRWGWY